MAGWKTENLQHVVKERDLLLGNIFKYMRFHLLWPSEEAEKRNEKTVFLMKAITLHVLVTLWMFFPICHAWHTITIMHDWTTFVNDVTKVGCAVCVLGMIFIFLINIDSFIQLSYSSFKYSLIADTPSKVLHCSHAFNKRFRLCYIAVVIILIASVSLKLISEIGCDKLDDYELCGFLINVRAPFIIDYTPFKEIAFVTLVFCSLVVFMGSLCLVGIMAIILMLLASSLDVLKTEIIKHIPCLQDIFLYSCFYYRQIMMIKKGFNSAFYPIAVLLFPLGTVSIALWEFQMIQDTSLISVGIFLAWFSSFATQHLTGQLLIDKNETLCEAVYNMKWYEYSPKMRKHIMMLLMITQKPFEIVSGPFSNLSKISYLTILKASYTYMTYLIRFPRKQ